jgi:hypothetical protein
VREKALLFSIPEKHFIPENFSGSMVRYHGKKIHPKTPLPPEPPCVSSFTTCSAIRNSFVQFKRRPASMITKYERYDSGEMFNIKLNV